MVVRLLRICLQLKLLDSHSGHERSNQLGQYMGFPVIAA